MNGKEVKATLQANIAKLLRVTFDDGQILSVQIANVDDEGFVHSGPDGKEPADYWTGFEGVTLVAAPD